MPRRVTRPRTVPALVALLLLAALPAHALGTRATAQGLGPRKASDLVTLKVFKNNGVNHCSVAFQRVLADGTTSQLTIPAGQVLVLTGVSFMTSGNAGFDNIYLLVGDASAFISPLPGGIVTGGSLDLHGVVVKPGVALCMRTNDNSTAIFGYLHGFLAPDE